MFRIIRVGSVSAAVALAGCGTIIRGSHQSIIAVSSPRGASVETTPASGTFATPTNLELERKNNYTLNFTSPGYTPAQFIIKHRISVGVLIGDLLLSLPTFFVAAIVDAVTGAWYTLSPEVAVVTMTKVGSGDGPAEIGVTVSPGRNGRGVTISSDVPGVEVEVMKR